MVSPSGPRLAGKYGTALLSLSISVEGGLATLGGAWGIVEDQAKKAATRVPSRDSWRVLGMVHVAETRDQALRDCTHGLPEFDGYFGGGAGFVPLAPRVDGEPISRSDLVSAYADSPNVLIGTPDDAIEYIERLLEESGGFGTFLMLGHDWADRDRTINCYRLMARTVIPHFKGRLRAASASHDWATNKREEIFGPMGQAVVNAIESHLRETEVGSTAG